jgi:hypothetical protein
MRTSSGESDMSNPVIKNNGSEEECKRPTITNIEPGDVDHGQTRYIMIYGENYHGQNLAVHFKNVAGAEVGITVIDPGFKSGGNLKPLIQIVAAGQYTVTVDNGSGSIASNGWPFTVN